MDMNRMTLYLEDDITKFKAKQAKIRIADVNPKLQVKSFHEELGPNNVFLVKADCVIDTSNSDSINTLVFDFCQQQKIPLVLARYSGSTAELLVAVKKVSKNALAECLKLPSTEKVGAISPATHAAAALVVAELFKILLGKGVNKRVTFDVWTGKYKEKRL